MRWDQRNEETPDLGKQPAAPVEECGASDARRWPGCADTFNQKFRAVLGPTRFPDSSVGKESACSAGDPSSIPGSGRSAGEGIVFLGFPGGSAGKETTCNAGDLGSVPGLERSPGEGKSYPLQYSSLENSMDCIVHGVAKSRTRLSDFHFHLLLLRTSACFLILQPSPITSSSNSKFFYLLPKYTLKP